MRPSKHKQKPKKKPCPIPESRLGGLETVVPTYLKRPQALKRVASLLQAPHRSLEQESELCRLVGLFAFDAETLLEAGVAYEVIKAYEYRLGLL
ncbi:MAG: hypothetical protein ACKO34_01935 [Vampirovibrionales bacterium]